MNENDLKKIEGELLESKKRTFGETLSKVFEWDGLDILDVLQIALEDSNFHSLNREIEKLRANEGLISGWDYIHGIGGDSES